MKSNQKNSNDIYFSDLPFQDSVPIRRYRIINITFLLIFIFTNIYIVSNFFIVPDTILIITIFTFMTIAFSSLYNISLFWRKIQYVKKFLAYTFYETSIIVCAIYILVYIVMWEYNERPDLDFILFLYGLSFSVVMTYVLTQRKVFSLLFIE